MVHTHFTYPSPRAIVAGNDLALGESSRPYRKPQWKETCIVVVQDDAQSGPDYVDAHHTVFMAISPYNRSTIRIRTSSTALPW